MKSICRTTCTRCSRLAQNKGLSPEAVIEQIILIQLREEKRLQEASLSFKGMDGLDY